MANKTQTGFYIDNDIIDAIEIEKTRTMRSKNFIVNEILKKELIE